MLTQFERTRYAPFDLKKIRPSRLLLCSVVLTAFIRALVPIANIMVVVALVWLVFAILGVQLWKGKFDYCNDASIEYVLLLYLASLLTIHGSYRENCTGTYVNAKNITLSRKWVTPIVNFNNVGQVRIRLCEEDDGWMRTTIKLTRTT